MRDIGAGRPGALAAAVGGARSPAALARDASDGSHGDGGTGPGDVGWAMPPCASRSTGSVPSPIRCSPAGQHLRRRRPLPGRRPGRRRPGVDLTPIWDHPPPPLAAQLRPGAAVVAPHGTATSPPLSPPTWSRSVLATGSSVASISVEAAPAVHRSGRGAAQPGDGRAGRLPRHGRRAAHLRGRRHRPLRRNGRHRARVDVALLPIWGWGGTLGPGHSSTPSGPRRRRSHRTSDGGPHAGGRTHPGERAPPAAGMVRKRPAAAFATALEDAGEHHRLTLLEPATR